MSEIRVAKRFLSVVGTAAALLVLSGMVSGASPQSSQDWNQWRGPGRDGVGDASALPAELPAELTRVWQVPVGEGHSSPVVVGETVFLLSREGEQEIVRAVSLVDGSEAWRQTYDAPYTMNSAARSHGPGPKSTPVFADGRLFTFGITGVLSAWDAATGEPVWRRDFLDQYPENAPIWGVAMSPIVIGDTVVAHVGWDEAGALMALDAATGETRWTNEEFTPGYASPILVEIEGNSVIVTQSDKHIIAVAAAAGRTLWSIPFATDFQQNSVTPLNVDGTLIFSGLDMDLFAVALRPVEGVLMRAGAPQGQRPGVGGITRWVGDEVWRNEGLPLYMGSPVRVGNRMFGMSHKRAGQFICIDLETGEPVWTSRGREGENAAIIVLGDRLALLTDEARLVIIAAGADAYEPLAEY